jgi:hypothetical protein
MTTPDYQYYFQKDEWSKDDIDYLLNYADFEELLLASIHAGTLPYRSEEHPRDIISIHNEALRYGSSDTTHIKKTETKYFIKPVDFVPWAISKDLPVPTEISTWYSSNLPNEKEKLDPREETTYLHIIGALLDFISGETPTISAHPDFTKRAKLIEILDKQYAGYAGLTKRTLQSKFAQAKRKFEDISR